MHKDLPSHLLPQHPLQQQKQLQHRLLPQQREQKKRREQEEDPVSDYDSDIDNNDDELAPFPRSSSRYRYQTNGNADSNSTRNSNDYYTNRSSSRADQSRSQSQAGMVQSMNNNSGLKSSPPPKSHPTHRQEDSGRGDLSDEERWSREDARREGFRRWKVIRRQVIGCCGNRGRRRTGEKKTKGVDSYFVIFFSLTCVFFPYCKICPIVCYFFWRCCREVACIR